MSDSGLVDQAEEAEFVGDHFAGQRLHEPGGSAAAAGGQQEEQQKRGESGIHRLNNDMRRATLQRPSLVLQSGLFCPSPVTIVALVPTPEQIMTDAIVATSTARNSAKCRNPDILSKFPLQAS